MTQIINNYSETITGSIDDTVTTITVSNPPTGVTVSVGDPLTLTLDDETNIEVVRVTDISGNDLTVIRGVEGTAQAWSDGAIIECRLTNQTLLDLSSDTGITESMAMTSVVPPGPYTYVLTSILSWAHPQNPVMFLTFEDFLVTVTSSASVYTLHFRKWSDISTVTHTESYGFGTSGSHICITTTRVYLIGYAGDVKVSERGGSVLSGEAFNISKGSNDQLRFLVHDPVGDVFYAWQTRNSGNDIYYEVDITDGSKGTVIVTDTTSPPDNLQYMGGQLWSFDGNYRLRKYHLTTGLESDETILASTITTWLSAYYDGVFICSRGTTTYKLLLPDVASTLSATGIKHLAALGDTVTGSNGESSTVVSAPTDDSVTVNGIWVDGTVTRALTDNDHIERQGGLNVWRS